MPSAEEFFKQKRAWSKYKDLILDYYLTPYLAKVVHIGKPVAIIDCFAGPGVFGDEERGSPLIIANHLSRLQIKGTTVVGMFIEAEFALFSQLESSLSSYKFPIRTRQGGFLKFIDEILDLADSHTVFLYVDPFQPGQLRFHDLISVYSKIRSGQSVETLINFMSTGFVRRAQGLRSRASNGSALDPQHHEVLACNEIAGGDYWQQAVCDDSLNQRDRIDAVVSGYAGRLKEWFAHVLTCPIRGRYGDEQPKYHLIFGSRHTDAFELMNRAMVKARREFVGSFFVDGMLFENQPEQEVVKPSEIEDLIVRTAILVGRTSWKLLRVRATLSEPCMYNDSELNKAIKAGISSGKLGSTATGRKIENDADVWPLTISRPKPSERA